MRGLVCLALMLASIQVLAHDEDIPIHNLQELHDWCKAESEAYYVGKSIAPYNWSASSWEKGDVLFVKGRWLIKSSYITVECRVAKGARRKYAVYQIQDK